MQSYISTVSAVVQVHYLCKGTGALFEFYRLTIILKLYRSTNRAVLQIYVCVVLQVPYLCCATGGLFVWF